MLPPPSSEESAVNAFKISPPVILDLLALLLPCLEAFALIGAGEVSFCAAVAGAVIGMPASKAGLTHAIPSPTLIFRLT